MKFTLKNFSLLITSLLLISNLQSAQQSINSVGGEEPSLFSSIYNNLSNRNNINNINNLNINNVNNLNINNVNNINLINININIDTQKNVVDLLNSIYKDEYIIVEKGCSYAKFKDKASFSYINNILSTFNNNINTQIKRSSIDKFINIVKNLRAESLMKLSLIFNCILNNNAKKEIDYSCKMSDQTEMYRIFCNINENVKSRINNSKYILKLDNELLNMIIAQYFELIVTDKMKIGKNKIFTSLLEALLSPVGNVSELLPKIGILCFNSDVLRYNRSSIINNIQNIKTISNDERDNNTKAIESVDVIFNEYTVECWNKMVEFVNNSKEEINGKRETDAYYKDYKNKNRLMRTIKQFINLTNIIFKDFIPKSK